MFLFFFGLLNNMHYIANTFRSGLHAVLSHAGSFKQFVPTK